MARLDGVLSGTLFGKPRGSTACLVHLMVPVSVSGVRHLRLGPEGSGLLFLLRTPGVQSLKTGSPGAIYALNTECVEKYGGDHESRPVLFLGLSWCKSFVDCGETLPWVRRSFETG